MKKKRWLIVAIFVIVVAAVAAGAYLWFGRSKTPTVHYLTAKVAKGTISQTVSATFTLNSANGATSVALGGGAASSSATSASSGSSSSTTASTSSLRTSQGSAPGLTLTASRSSDGAMLTSFAVLASSDEASTEQASVGLPTVTAVSPSSGSTAGGTSVTVAGSGFSTSAPTVKFGANAATGVSVSSDTSLTCTSPAGGAGTVDVTVTTTAGSSAASDADHFTYQVPASPTSTATPTPTPTRTAHPTSSPTASGSSSSGSFSRSGSSSSSGSSSGTGSSTSTSSSSTSTFSGVVTRLVRPAGTKPLTLQRLLIVSGKPVFAFVSPTPLWENLSASLASGSQRANVAALQKALKQQGYYKKAINGDFTSATETAFKRWQKANGLSQTGVLDVTRFVWMPTGSVLTSWTVGLGSHVSSGTALASVVSPSQLSATALISQADIAQLKVGQKTQMTIDGYTSDAFTGRISFISSEPASSSSASGSSSSTQYSITVTPQNLPTVAKSGMTGTLAIVLAQRTNVLLVPTSAVSGTSSMSFVRVMQNGEPVFRQVQTGMTTSSYTEITSGLAAGETVITGQYSNGATSTGTSSNSTSGGFFRRSTTSGGGFPSGGFPSGGFPGAGGGQ